MEPNTTKYVRNFFNNGKATGDSVVALFATTAAGKPFLEAGK
jgi:hypothetical protein